MMLPEYIVKEVSSWSNSILSLSLSPPLSLSLSLSLSLYDGIINNNAAIQRNTVHVVQYNIMQCNTKYNANTMQNTIQYNGIQIQYKHNTNTM